ncbi:TPA: hypothetical protein ACSI6R_001954, partial [Klebsiella aerogenes]
MSKLELNIEQAEFNDIFEDQQLWQVNAAESLVTILNELGNYAKKYRSEISTGSVKKNSHSHDAILISGGRGTGKTIFLKNAEAIWIGKGEKTKEDRPKIHFTSVIDPTLLHDHDSFTNVIVAHIYNETQIHMSNLDSTNAKEFEAKKNKYYDSLRKLSEAIDHPGNESIYSGLDKIIKYSSGIRIEILFQEFVAAAIDIIQCDAMVLPIDDIDMALNQAYPVLEEIRKLLSCPYIIPLVSGDANLYKSLVKLSLAENISSIPCFRNFDFFNDKSNEFNSILESTTDSYLTKVLPHQYRINILS